MRISISFALAALLSLALSGCRSENRNDNTSQMIQPPPPSNARWVAKFRSPSSLGKAGISLAVYSYTAVSVVSDKVIFAAGDMPHPNKQGSRTGVVVRTTDGGESWKEILLGQSGADITVINSACFISPTHGWAVGADSGTNAVSLSTTDSGESWSISRPKFDQIPTTVFFIDEQTGWMGGATPMPVPERFSGGKEGKVRKESSDDDFDDENTAGGPSDILHTTDGGRTWRSQRRVPVTITDIFFLNANIGWAGGYKGVIYHTTDGGRTWNAQRSGLELPEGTPDIPDLESQRYIIYDIYFFDPQNGFAAAGNEEGAAGRALGTTVGGEPWAQRWIVNGSGVHAMTMISPNEAWATVSKDPSGQQASYVYRTVDGGRSWLAEPIEFEQVVTLLSIDARGASNMWAAGDGAVFKRVE